MSDQPYVPRGDFPQDELTPLAIAGAYLRENESLIWANWAGPTALAKSNIATALFGIPFLGFSLFWTFGAASSGAPFFFWLFGIPFILVGAGLVGSPLWHYKKGQSTVYAITDRRALIIGGFPSVNITSFQPADIGNLDLTLNADGSGNIIFHRESYRDSDGDRRTRKTGFFGVADARAVEA